MIMEGKNFIAIGKILFETPAFSWNIPHSHFIVNKTESGLYQATNLEFVLDACGEALRDSIKILAGLTSYHTMNIMFNGRGHDQFEEDVYTTAMETYWREYRKIECELSRTKKDIGHKLDRYYIEAVKELIDKNMQDIIYQKAKWKAHAILEQFNNIKSDAITIDIEYKNLEAA
ncbi:MAG: hypothetical protein LBP19_00115 [Treponema sp.]|jgi:hypothetical protein|nr:hypothetical protein [Treponema sp.]